MTPSIEPPACTSCGQTAPSDESAPGAIGLTPEAVVPPHLLDGGEIVHFAIKPAPWFILLVSLRWIVAAGMLACLAWVDVVAPSYRVNALQAAVLIVAGRMGWAAMEWVSRLYVLTNRRVISIRGVAKVEVFECMLDRIQNTHVVLSPPERLVRVGTIAFQTAAAGSTGGTGTWRMVAKPLDVHEQLLAAIQRARPGT